MTQFSGLDSAPVSITQAALAHNFELEERERREKAQINKDFYYGKQEQTLTLMNDDVEPLTMNLTKPIINKRVGMLYSRPLVREFDGPSQSISFLESVYEDNHFDTFMKRVDLLAELTGSCLIHPSSDGDLHSGVRLLTYDGTQFSAVGQEADPMVPEAISLLRMVTRLYQDPHQTQQADIPNIERTILQQIWTPDSVVLYDNEELISSEPNELGFLPFVNIMGEEVPDSFVGHPPADLVMKANHAINQMLTQLAFAIKMQSHTPIVFQGFKQGDSVVVHPGRAINLPLEADASTLSLNPKLMETLEAVRFLEDRIYTCSSVPRISVEGGEGTSGRELMVRWFPLLQVFQEKTVRYNRYELAIANMILATQGYELIDSVHIEWPEESVMPISAEEEMLAQDISLGIKTPIDEILRRNPELTEEEAVQEYIDNTEINARLSYYNNEDEAEAGGTNE